jgi:hypothetical protein
MMKIGQVGMCFQPLPIVHLDKPSNDGGKNVIIIKPCMVIATNGTTMLTLLSHHANTPSIPFTLG